MKTELCPQGDVLIGNIEPCTYVLCCLLTCFIYIERTFTETQSSEAMTTKRPREPVAQGDGDDVHSSLFLFLPLRTLIVSATS